MTPKLAACLVGTKINLPSLSFPPLLCVPSVLALISSPGDESLGSWGGRLLRAQSSLSSWPEPPGQRHCVRGVAPHLCGCEERRGSAACWWVSMHGRVSA